MKLSIIVPSYNAERYIRQTLNSVCQQNDVDKEVIAVDGGSTDGTLDILKNYGDRITWISEKDKGETDAINKGLKMAIGDIVAWLDADDIYLPHTLWMVSTYFDLHPDCQWLYGKCRIIDKDGCETRQAITKFKELFQKRYSYSKLLVLDFIAQPAFFWRRQLIKEIGLLDDRENLVMDYDYLLRLGAKYQPGYINQYLACWRSHGESSTSKELVQDMRDALRIARKYSPNRPLINLLQFMVFVMAITGYKAMGGRK